MLLESSQNYSICNVNGYTCATVATRDVFFALLKIN